ncbi:MAG: PspC domain-containing protein [Alistipes sp.]|nr:PspC domain-containing protein [Alistipes sp.]
MNEIKKCSLSGIGFTLEKVAYNRLNDYLNSLKEAYKNSADCEEIMADIEARIAELILSAQSDTQCVVTLPIVENIIAQLGSPEDISGEESKPKAESSTRIPRRLYRDMENSKLGGVCAGLAKYFGVEAVWLRLAMASPLILVVIGAPFLHWLSVLGGNLCAVFFMTYLILWFAIPSAKSAREKLEMEGEAISAKSIADRQGATQEEKAKSSVASAVTALGRVAVIALKIMLGLMLFPIVAIVLTLSIILVCMAVGLSSLPLVQFGEFGNLTELLSEFGAPLMVFALLLVLIPAIYIGYLFVTLLINKRPRWWVLIVSILLWIFIFICTSIAGISYAEDYTRNAFYLDMDDEVERIMKKSDEMNLSRQIMEQLNEAPTAEQQAEIERLLYDQNAKSIDK